MANNRIWRTLSAFNRPTRSWAPISLGNAESQLTQKPSLTSPSNNPKLSLISWNIDAFSSRPVARAKLILDRILEGPTSPDIIFLQEVTTGVRDSLLNDARVRAAFLVTDAEDQTSFKDVPFATVSLLSTARFASELDLQKEGDGIEGGGKFMLGRVSRITLPSKFKRDALCVDIIPPTAPDTVFRLINVHLDSLWHTLHYRAQQVEILANVLREPGCSGGIIAGDFNAISPEDDGLIDKNGLVDAWVALHRREDGATWSVGVERRDGLGPGRLDKVATMGPKAEEMEALRPGVIEISSRDRSRQRFLLSTLMQKNTKRKERPWRDSQPDSEDGRVPHGALYFQAYEADIVRGPQAKSLAESLESSSAGNSNTALLRVNESSTSLDSPTKDVWVDRYDIRLLLDPFDRRLIPTADPCKDRSESPTGWSDLPSDSEDTFFASSEEVEDHRRAKKRRKNEEAREHRLRAFSSHEEGSEEQEKLESNVWGSDDEEPDEAVRQVMQKTARLILSASNPTQMEMKILVDFGEKEPSFAFLRGRWKHRWKEICSAMSQSLAAEAKAGENSGIGGLADYGDSEDEEPE